MIILGFVRNWFEEGDMALVNLAAKMDDMLIDSEWGEEILIRVVLDALSPQAFRRLSDTIS